MKKVFAWVDKNFEPVLMTVLFYSMTILVTLQVVLRFVFNSGFSWGEEVSRFIFVWLMYFSISYTTRNHRHIKVSFLVNKFNEKVQKIIMLIVDFLFLIFSSVIFISAIKICQSVIEYNDRAVTIDVSMNIIYGAGFIGFALMIIRLIQGILWKFKNFSRSLEYFENYTGIYTGAKEICFMPREKEVK
ncbi:TRAP transporter small permease [Maledivibacter halophilus]|uniref:TRAP-type C4-dicarboxylate transport system, small permease component n=1 Tax=Maledivibacter halophilus TaxID=36842 RepID=A0A1T5IB02_9FIRM|nr:TRAP transporter small permease [Maledivibacter halophilus]SKC36349.1 TRAP-type C4-dicarboxylate transport system, small permease component [Maledivibacter halophilus]